MKYLAHKLQAWRRRRYLKRAASAAGISLRELESHCVYFKMTLEEMVAYHKYFGRLPSPEYTTVIRHIGVENLIKEVKKKATN